MGDVASMNRADQLDAMLAQMERRVLEVLAELPDYHTMQRRVIQRATYGSDTFGASHIASALGRLKNRGLVVEARRDVYRLTAAGRAQVGQREVEPEGAA